MTSGTGRRTPPSFRGASLSLDGREAPLLSGAMHYFRVPPEHWAEALTSIRALGLDAVESYVPWGVHERAAGEHDFGGCAPGNDLGHFLDLAAEAGLRVVLRPGPHVNAELECFGLPRRVVEDPSCQALSPTRNPVLQPFPPRMFPVPSHASHAYHAEVGAWFEAVGRALEGRLYPEGPVVALQVDNELGGFFRNGPFCQDYHPDALAAYRAELEARYGRLASLEEAHGRSYGSFDAVEPPTRFDASTPEELAAQLDWARFQEGIPRRSLARMRALLAEAGLGSVPTTHNVPMGESALPLRLAELAEVVDLVGLDHYHPASQVDTVARRVRRARGTLGYAYAPELGMGGPHWFTPFDFEDSLFSAMAACAYGLHGFSLYMAVARDRWFGAPIDARGRLLPEADRVAAFVRAFRELELHRLELPTDVALVLPAEYARLARITHALGPLGPSGLEALGLDPTAACLADRLGFAEPIQLAHAELLARLESALEEAGVPYVLIDSDADPARFEGYRLLVSPSYELADPVRFERLAAAAEGGTRVALGPRLPERDLALRPHAFRIPDPVERIDVRSVTDARALVARWMEELGHAPAVSLDAPTVRVTVHYRDGEPAVLFLIHAGPEATEARVRPRAPWSLRDAISGERFDATRTATIPMAGRSVRMLAIEARHPTRSADASRSGPASPPPRRPAARRRRR